MKKIGLIGGMSWESTYPYYKILNETINARLGGLHSADLVMHSVDFELVESSIHQNDWETSNRLLSEAACQLEKAGVDFYIICSNTMHKCLPAIEARTGLPNYHIVDATSEAIREQGVQSALLLGTRFTMEIGFNKDRFEANGVRIVVPDLEDRIAVDRIIFEELCRGVIREASRQQYVEIIRRSCPAGAEGVILGCTEIGLLIGQKDVTVPVFDTTAIHAERSALRMLEV